MCCHRNRAVVLAVLASACGASSEPARSDPGASIVLRAGDDLQDALDQAQPGDEIVLEAGAVFRGPFTLPRKPHRDWITLRSSAEGALPPPGTRVAPSHAPLMPKLESSRGPAVQAAAGAHHFRLVGLEIRPEAGAFLTNLVLLGSDETSFDAVPDSIRIERCWLHGDPARGTRRGVALNSRHTAIVDSHLSDFKEKGADSQAIGGWNGPGPFEIENNHLEGAGENILFGGADPTIPNLVPSDIRIRRNHLTKPLAWKADEPEYAGTPWTIKNLLELKNARRVLIEDNVLEHNWVDGQNGFAVLFTVRNQDGRAPWSTIEDVTFRGNVVRRTASGINILARDNHARSGTARRIVVSNNLLEDVGGERWGGGGRLLQILDGAADVVVEHNTAFHAGNFVTAAGRPNPGFVFQNNIVLHNQYGFIGDGTGPGRATLLAYFPGAVFRRNVVVGGDAALYPDDNFFPPTVERLRFDESSGAGRRLSPSSPYRGAATDGKDVGALPAP
jgi:hypothetical protein